MSQPSGPVPSTCIVCGTKEGDHLGGIEMDDTTHEECRQAESEWCLGLLNLGHDFAHVELLRLRARELLPLWHICK
jgi:hypothetical protein